MTSIRVLDSDWETVSSSDYDIGLFASGYESRCIYVPGLINRESIACPLIFGFKEEAKAEGRQKNDKFYSERWERTPILLSGNDEKPIYENLHRWTEDNDGPIRILVDYSSMSRLWYTALLNWARFAASGRPVVIDFLYTAGQYENAESDFVIRDMVSLPGCEGRAYRLRESVAVFGLGFHGLAAQCVLDHLEPDRVYTFLAAPGATREYEKRTRESNKALIENYRTKAVLELPLISVESAYRGLAETIAPYRRDGEITLIPMGPKPHVLAAILVAMRFPEVACLRVTSMTHRGDVKPREEVFATRVIIHTDDSE
jgi:hypothetical protein